LKELLPEENLAQFDERCGTNPWANQDGARASEIKIINSQTGEVIFAENFAKLVEMNIQKLKDMLNESIKVEVSKNFRTLIQDLSRIA
jgi:hypothetical protein